MSMSWYVVHTYSGYENKAKAALEDAIRRAGMDQKFGEVLVPTEQVVEVRDGKKKTTTRKVMGLGWSAFTTTTRQTTTRLMSLPVWPSMG